MDPNWYRDFFHGVPNDLWQQVMPAEHTLAEVDMAWRELRLKAGDHVLDVPCGFGRHTVELARRGCQVTGLDISADNLSRARRAASEACVALELRQADMADLPALPACDAALTMGNSFGFLDQARTARFIGSVAAGLRAGGRWLIDYGAVAESILPHLRPVLEYPSPAISVRIENKYLPWESCLETTFTFTRGGQVETRVGWQFVFTLSEVRRMLAAAGLETVACYGNVAGEAYELGSPYLYLVAEKHGS